MELLLLLLLFFFFFSEFGCILENVPANILQYFEQCKNKNKNKTHTPTPPELTKNPPIPPRPTPQTHRNPP
jgi:hypothetical protein